MVNVGKCALTKEICELQNSHIYPKFMFNMMRELGGGKFRSADSPNKVLQDGFKMPLLGKKAERDFCKYEDWFADNIFRPYCLTKKFSKDKTKYDYKLYRFIVSILWRQLYIYLNTENAKIFKLYKKLTEAEEQWRCFLNDGIVPLTYNRIYLTPLNPNNIYIPEFVKYSDWYLLRGFESSIMYNDDYTECALYCKCPCFSFWGVINSLSISNITYGLRVNIDGGKLDLRKFNIGDSSVVFFIISRILETNRQIDSATLSDKQQMQVLKNLRQSSVFYGSELEQLIRET